MKLERNNGSDERTAAAIAELIGSRSVGCCESFTAGRVAAGLADAPGASAWFRGGVVSYQESVKRELLGVTSQSIYTESAASEMAAAVAAILRVEVAVATTGVAGDEPVDGVDPGTAFFATVVDGCPRTATTRFDGPAEEVCAAATTFALGMLRAHLAGEAHADERFGDDTFEHRQELANDLLAFDSGYD